MNDESPRLLRVYREIEGANNVDLALRIFQEAYRIDFMTYHLSQTTVDVVDAPFVRSTYSDAWVSRYLLRGYVKVDPIVEEGFQRQLPFDWREIELPDQAKDFLADAHHHGVGASGFSIPIADKSRRALLSLNSCTDPEEWTDMISAAKSEWIEIAFLIHRKAMFELYGDQVPAPVLSPPRARMPPLERARE